MKFKLLVIILGLSSTLASADIAVMGSEAVNAAQEISANEIPADSYYARVSQYFVQGDSSFYNTNLTGMYSGRCYLADEPNAALNGILVFQPNSGSDVNGPIAGSDARYFAFRHSSLSPQYFDTLDNTKISEVNRGILSLAPYISRASIAEGSVAELFGSATQYNTEWLLKKAGEYFVLKIRRQTTHAEVAVCYYFRKVAD